MWQANVQLPVDSNQVFHDNTIYWARLAHSMTPMDCAIVQSWEEFPDQIVPDSVASTFTGLVRDYATTVAHIPFPPPKVSISSQSDLVILGRTTAKYRIEYKNALDQTSPWTPLVVIEMASPTVLWSDPTLPKPNSRFYRVVSGF
jgi:hypothetical protein